jgi:hypothetical protein
MGKDSATTTLEKVGLGSIYVEYETVERFKYLMKDS